VSWPNDAYVRPFLDSREKWGTVMSVTAAAGLMVFLADQPHKDWLKYGPLVIGVFGSIYVFLVNCYYKQAEAMAGSSSDKEKQSTRAKSCLSFAHKLRILAWMNSLVPLLVGSAASVALKFGGL